MLNGQFYVHFMFEVFIFVIKFCNMPWYQAHHLTYGAITPAQKVPSVIAGALYGNTFFLAGQNMSEDTKKMPQSWSTVFSRQIKKERLRIKNDKTIATYAFPRTPPPPPPPRPHPLTQHTQKSQKKKKKKKAARNNLVRGERFYTRSLDITYVVNRL